MEEMAFVKKGCDEDVLLKSLDSGLLSLNNVEALLACLFDADEPPDGYWKQMRLVNPVLNLVGIGFKQYVSRLVVLFRVFTFLPVIFSGLVWGMQDALLTFYLTVKKISISRLHKTTETPVLPL